MSITVFAQTDNCIEGLGPFKGLCEDLSTTPSDEAGASLLMVIASIISRILGLATILAGLWFFAQLLIAGFSWLTSGGEADKLAAARDRIVYAFTGLVIVVGALAIMSVLQIFFGIDFLLRNPADLVTQLKGG